MRLSNVLQDELLGLSNDPQERYLAEQIDPTVLLRQSEDRQVQTDKLSTTRYPNHIDVARRSLRCPLWRVSVRPFVPASCVFEEAASHKTGFPCRAMTYTCPERSCLTSMAA